MRDSDYFEPPLFLKNAHVQTILASTKLRTFGPNRMKNVAQKKIIETNEGIKLLGFHSVHGERTSKGLVIFLHGWEGSSDSTYVLRCARILYRNGYDILRLNFRDHGDSHHLNTGIFYAVLLDEIYQAVTQAARWAQSRPVFLIGFSLGGNFVLRILKKCVSLPIANLRYAVSISPVLDPQKSTDRVDRIAFIRKYFLAKWRRSLTRKQELYPDLYDFGNVMDLKTIQAVTDVLLAAYSDFKSAQEYFKAYAVMGSGIKDIDIPLTIIAAQDDPIIPVEDFYGLKLNKNAQLIIQPHGGHNGFISGYRLQSWYENKVVTVFDQILRQTSG